MKFTSIIGITLISGFSGILLAQLILPVFTSNLQETLQEMNILDSANLMSWAAILMTLIGLIFTVIILSNEFKSSTLFKCLGLSFVFTIIFLCAGSWIYLVFNHPDLFIGTSLLLKLGKFFSYPTLISLYLESFQPIWIISTVLFLFIFNFSFYYLSEAK